MILGRRWEAHGPAARHQEQVGLEDWPECSHRTGIARRTYVRFPKAVWSKSFKTGLRGTRLVAGLNRTLRYRRIMISCFFHGVRPFA